MKAIYLALLLCLTFTPYLALAQTTTATATNPCSLKSIPGGYNDQTLATTAFPRCINQIYVWSLGIGSLLALIMMVVGGYRIMTSSGNAEQASKGKENITAAIIGLVLLFCAYLILHTINPDLTSFNLSSLNQLNTPPSSAPRTTGTPSNPGPTCSTPPC